MSLNNLVRLETRDGGPVYIDPNAVTSIRRAFGDAGQSDVTYTTESVVGITWIDGPGYESTEYKTGPRSVDVRVIGSPDTVHGKLKRAAR